MLGSLALAGGAAATPQAECEVPEGSFAHGQLSRDVGEVVLELFMPADEEQLEEALEMATELLAGDLSPYERGVVLRLRGNHAFQLDDYQSAIRDYEAAAETCTLTRDELISLRVNVGQLHRVLGNYSNAIEAFEWAIDRGALVDEQLAQFLAATYLEAALEREGSAEQRSLLERGLPFAERFYELATAPTETDFAMMVSYYQQLRRPRDELTVVRDRVEAYPNSRSNWQALLALFAEMGWEEDLFAANKLMYLNGLFEGEHELIRLVQYYAYFENPYRGAIILEREINAGSVEDTPENLTLLSDLWRQASDFDRAIVVLAHLSDVLGDGESALRLAEAYFQENQFAQSEAALELAIERGGLENEGAAWELLGNVRFEQVSDRRADRAQLREALAAFEKAAQFPQSRTAAEGWIRFINGFIEPQPNGLQRIRILIDSCRLSLEAELRILLLTGEIEAGERALIPEDAFPERCAPYFNKYGEQIREAHWTDEEFEAAQAQRAAREGEG